MYNSLQPYSPIQISNHFNNSENTETAKQSEEPGTVIAIYWVPNNTPGSILGMLQILNTFSICVKKYVQKNGIC